LTLSRLGGSRPTEGGTPPRQVKFKTGHREEGRPAVQQVTRVELIINLKSAKALGLIRHDEGLSRRRFDFRSVEAINTPKNFNAE
jgi:hypothetical protein